MNGFGDKCKEIFRHADMKKKGKISYMDFITAATDHKKLMTKDNIAKAFNLFDLKKTGKININDFAKRLPMPK